MLMGRMGKDGYSTDSIQLSARIPADLKEAFREWCDERGVSMTEALCEMISSVVEGDEETEPWLPDDDQLRAAWQILDQYVSARSRRIPVEEAKTLLSSELNVPKETVKRNLLRPLEDHDPPLIAANWGNLTIRKVQAKPIDDRPSDQDSEPASVDGEEVREALNDLENAVAEK